MLSASVNSMHEGTDKQCYVKQVMLTHLLFDVIPDDPATKGSMSCKPFVIAV